MCLIGLAGAGALLIQPESAHPLQIELSGHASYHPKRILASAALACRLSNLYALLLCCAHTNAWELVPLFCSCHPTLPQELTVANVFYALALLALPRVYMAEFFVRGVRCCLQQPGRWELLCTAAQQAGERSLVGSGRCL